MDEHQIADMWSLFREYVDNKNLEAVATKFIDLLADLGITEEELQGSLGVDNYLDNAINYFLDIEEEDDYELNEWDE